MATRQGGGDAREPGGSEQLPRGEFEQQPRGKVYWGSLRDAAMINAQVNSAGATGEPMPSATATPLSVQALMST